jgi:hypothetical protein
LFSSFFFFFFFPPPPPPPPAAAANADTGSENGRRGDGARLKTPVSATIAADQRGVDDAVPVGSLDAAAFLRSGVAADA